MEQREKLKPKLVPEHEGTYINMQRLIQVQGEHVVTGVPARYVMGLIEELNAAKQRERVLRELCRDIREDDGLNEVIASVGEHPPWWSALLRESAALATPAPEQNAACSCTHSRSDHVGTVAEGSNAMPCIRCSCIQYKPTQTSTKNGAE